MSHREKLCSCWECLKGHSETGKSKERSRRFVRPLDKDDTTLKSMSVAKGKTIEQLSSTPESVATSKKKTSKGKRTSSSRSSPKENSSKKSEEDLTSREKGLYPFWDESCREISNDLLSATLTDSLDLELNSLNGCANKTLANSWFSVEQSYLQNEKCLKMYLPSSTSSVADSTDLESIRIKSKKIRIYPESKLANVWNKWISAARWCYNQAIGILKTTRIGKYDLRSAVMTAAPEWVSKTPYNPRQLSVFQAFAAHKSAVESGGEARVRSFRDAVKSIRFQKDNWKNNTFYPQLTSGLSFNASECLPDKFDYEPILLKERGRWFICFAISYVAQVTGSTQAIFIDPGVRCFATGFDGQKFLEVGSKDIGRIQRLCFHLDKLMSRISLASGRQFKRVRYKNRLAAQKIRVKIKSLTSEMHNKLASHLTKNYGVIFLPVFETSNMVRKAKRRLNNKTARAMLTLSHYSFKQTLKHHATKRGCVVVDVTEEYTSKTCSCCGQIHSKLGGNKLFVCPSCGYTVGRDKNGAFNILLKALRDTSISWEMLNTVISDCRELPG